MMVSLGLFCLLITGGGFCEEEEEEDQQQEVVGEEEKNQGIKVYGMCIPPIISCHLCTHFLYKDTTTTFQGKRDKKKGEKEKEKLGEEERKKNAMGVVGPNHFCVSLCRFGDLEDGVDKVFASFLIYKSHGATPLQTT